MSRLTQRPAVAPLNPWTNLSTGNSNQAYAALPTFGAQPSSGTGFFDPNFGTYVGQKFDTSDGRVLTLVQNGVAALAAGTLIQAPAEITAFQKLSMTVPTATPATAGTYQILVTNGSTVLNVNGFAQGYAVVSAGAGIGQTLKISTHQAAANAATFIVNLEDPIQTTLDVTSKISLVFNPYGGGYGGTGSSVNGGVITKPTTETGTPVGVSLYGIAASTVGTFSGTTGLQTANGVNQYGLIVSKGPTSCLIDTVTNVGYPLGASTAVAGALAVATLTRSPQVGISMQTLTSAQNGMVYLQL